MNLLPKSRNENIVVQNAENEVLIYDTVTNQAFCLNETSAKVFNHCDGKTSFDELKRKYKYTDELIYLALDELKKQNLLADDAAYLSPFAGMNRREVIRKVGFATMVALPLISTLVAPTAAAAQSASGGGCAGTCVARGADQCAGRTGQRINRTGFSSTDGSCTGTVTFSDNVTCNPGGLVSTAGDRCIS